MLCILGVRLPHLLVSTSGFYEHCKSFNSLIFVSERELGTWFCLLWLSRADPSCTLPFVLSFFIFRFLGFWLTWWYLKWTALTMEVKSYHNHEQDFTISWFKWISKDLICCSAWLMLIQSTQWCCIVPICTNILVSTFVEWLATMGDDFADILLRSNGTCIRALVI